jgi:hypothetical protein
MLHGTQSINSKNSDKSIKYHEIIPAVFLDFGPKDETLKKTVTIKDESEPGAVPSVKFVTVPVREKDGKQVFSVHSLSELESQAENYVSELFPGSEPMLKILELASDGINVFLKNRAKPAKEMSEEEAMEKTVKTLMATNPGMSFMTATQFAIQVRNSFKAKQAA